MSYEDLEEARTKRAAKEKATVGKGKGKRGRKRKSPAPEAGSPEPWAKVARRSEVPHQRHGGPQWRGCIRTVLLD